MDINTFSLGFLSSFFANLCSGLIIGVIFSLVLAWWIGRQLNRSERVEQRKNKRKEEIEKTIRYLTLLGKDISSVYPSLESWIDQLKNSSEGFEPITSGDIPRIEYRFWDVIQRSGDVPSLMSPEIVHTLTLFYAALADARQSMDWAIEGWKIGESHSAAKARIRKFGKLTLEGLERAEKQGKTLEAQVDGEIQRLALPLTEH
jgi:hypothetical protein